MASPLTSPRSPRAGAWTGFILVLALAVAGGLLPALGDPAQYHRFADARAWAGVPNAANVLSNACFLVAGIVASTAWMPRADRVFGTGTRTSLATLAAGLVLTAVASAWYHLAPDDARLVLDRFAMTAMFAGVVGAAVSQRLGDGAGLAVLAGLLLLGPVSVFHWAATGNVMPYAVVQFGAIAVVIALLVLVPAADDPLPWGTVVIVYGIAKLAELGDGAIWTATHGFIGGHAVKHALGAAAGALVFRPLWRARRGAAAHEGAAHL